MTPKVIQAGRYALIDLETTGLSRKVDQAIQIAVCVVDNAVTRIRAYYTVKPTVEIKPGAEEKHGISMSALAYSPSFADIASELRTLIGDRIVMGHGALTFDVPILARQFKEAGVVFSPKIIDVVRVSRKVHPGISHALGNLAAYLNLPMLPHHDAWYDCKMTWQIFGEMATRYPEIGDADPETLIERMKEKIDEPNGEVAS